MSEAQRVAVMLIVNATGELLLQVRDDDPNPRYPNHWGVVGGSAEDGESFAAAVEREAFEEIEAVFEGYEYWDTYRSRGNETAIFATRLDTPANEIPLHGGQRLQWFLPQAAMMQPLVPWLAKVLPDFARSELYRRLAPEATPPVNTEAASVIFVNREGELLLRLRGSEPGLPFPAMWDLIGGGMEGGESPEDAIVRETLEELGLVLEDFIYWGDVRGVVLIHVFLAALDLAASALDLQEGERVEWVAPEDIGKLPLVPYMERLIPQVVGTAPYRDLFPGRGT